MTVHPPSDRRNNGQAPAGGAARPAPARSSLRIRISIAALIAFGVVGFVVSVLVSGDDGADEAATASPAVDRVIPAAGDEVLQQQQVGVVLDPRYRLSSLVVYPNFASGGGVDVTDEVVRVDGLNRFEFNPGAGRLIEALSPDTNCAVATFVLIARPEEADTVRWCFSVS